MNLQSPSFHMDFLVPNCFLEISICDELHEEDYEEPNSKLETRKNQGRRTAAHTLNFW